ncbi:hypothetical protein I3B23_11230 [Salmonella enterica]|nr:hypothetical protein [Salmonella enterica]
MSYFIHMLLDNSIEPDLDINTLKEKLNMQYLREWKGDKPSIVFRREILGPRKNYDHLELKWSDSWHLRLYFETTEMNESVEIDACYISGLEKDKSKSKLIKEMKRRVVILSKDDPDNEHSDYIVELMAFFENIPGSVFFDPNNKRILNS